MATEQEPYIEDALKMVSHKYRRLARVVTKRSGKELAPEAEKNVKE